MSKKRTDIIPIDLSDIPPTYTDRKKGEIDTEVFIPKTEKKHENKPKQKIKKSNDPRSKFYEYCDNFYIDSFQIPRPLRTPLYGGYDITDSKCALYALTLLSVPHIDFDVDLEPIGWLDGPHLLVDWLGQDWSLAFDGERLKNHLKTNPWLAVTDSAVQLAIRILRVKCDQGTPRDSRHAKQILEKIGLNLFIPERATKRRTNDIVVRYYSNHPEILVTSVRLYEFVIKKFWNDKSKTIGDEKKIKYVGEAFRIIFGVSMSNAMAKDMKKSTKLNSPANAAIALIEFETSSDYEPLRHIFYDNVKEIHYSQIYTNLDLITDNKGEKLSFISDFKKQNTGK